MPSKLIILSLVGLVIIIAFIIWFLRKLKSETRKMIQKKPAMSGYEGDTMLAEGKKK